MSVDVIIAIIVAISIVVAFACFVLGYSIRVHEEKKAYMEEQRIRSVLKRWNWHTTNDGCTIFSPHVKEGGIK